MVLPLFGPYCASKSALAALTDALRMELESSRLPVCLVEPGVVDTPMHDKARRLAFGGVGRASSEEPWILKSWPRPFIAQWSVADRSLATLSDWMPELWLCSSNASRTEPRAPW